VLLIEKAYAPVSRSIEEHDQPFAEPM